MRGWLRWLLGSERAQSLDWYPRWLAHLEAGAPDNLEFTYTADPRVRKNRCESLLHLIGGNDSEAVDPYWLPHLAAAFLFSDVEEALLARLQAKGTLLGDKAWKGVEYEAGVRQRVRSGEYEGSEFRSSLADEDHIEGLRDSDLARRLDRKPLSADFVLAAGLWTRGVLSAPSVKQLVDVDAGVLWRQQAALNSDGRRELRIYLSQRHTLPAGLGTLRSLDELYVGGGGLKELPADLASLSFLQELSLEHLDLDVLPNWFISLQCLESLALWSTGLAGLPEEVFRLLKLRRLRFNGSISSTADAPVIPERGVICEQLKFLSITMSSMKTLPPSVARLTNLRELHLQSSGFTIPGELGRLGHLERLVIIPSLSELYLPTSLTSLRSLRFAKLRLCSDQACTVLAQMPWLEELDLIFHTISESGIEALKKALPDTKFTL